MREMHVMVADILSAEMDALHRHHGPWRLIRALVATLVRNSSPFAANRTSDLDNHMLRDIGLPENVPEVDFVLQSRFVDWRNYL